ncbi:hypothetical protein GCM10009737_13090 [Nocardioides lentus]|uniref:Alpha/beta hydrolase fold-3 domain-containing protein n=1 Tax=Nocardioides lentus TaxID=338077 RepID=A0ABP5AGL9_9ACTN
MSGTPPPEPLPPGVRIVGHLVDRVPGLRVASLSPERLTRMQDRGLPDRGPAGWAVGLAVGHRRRGTVVQRTAVSTPAGPLPVRVHRPAGPARVPRPVVLALHGGGFVVGSARQSDFTASWVARALGAVVVAPDYRLAPRHRFPAAVEDCRAALGWTHAHAADLGGDPERLGVLGESAGGNLAAVTTLSAAAEDGPRVRAQALLYPATDLTEDVGATPSYVEHASAPVLTAEGLRFFRDSYVGDDGDPADWRFSPVRSPDLATQPPTLVVLAGHDPLRDTGAAYADALAAAGADVAVREFPAMPHGFVGFPYLARDATTALRTVVAHLRTHLA